MNDTSVREFRLHFTGRDSFVEPVEVQSYGRPVGHWFPPGTLERYVAERVAAALREVPAGAAPGDPRDASLGQRGDPPDVSHLPSRNDDQRPPQAVRKVPTPAERQKARDDILRGITGGRATGSGYPD